MKKSEKIFAANVMIPPQFFKLGKDKKKSQPLQGKENKKITVVFITYRYDTNYSRYAYHLCP